MKQVKRGEEVWQEKGFERQSFFPGPKAPKRFREGIQKRRVPTIREKLVQELGGTAKAKRDDFSGTRESSKG